MLKNRSPNDGRNQQKQTDEKQYEEETTES